MRDNGAAQATLQGWITGLRDAADNYYGRTAEGVAVICKSELDMAIAEQRSAAGQAWLPKVTTYRRTGKPRKDSVGKILANGAAAVTTKAIGSVVMIVIEGVEVFSQFGSKHQVRREIVPIAGLGKLGNAIAKGIVDMGSPWMTRKGRHDRGSGGVRMNPRAST